MFQGSMPADMRSVVREHVAEWKCDDVAIGCSGNFTVERTLAGGPRLHGNDVGLFSCALGAPGDGDVEPEPAAPLNIGSEAPVRASDGVALDEDEDEAEAEVVDAEVVEDPPEIGVEPDQAVEGDAVEFDSEQPIEPAHNPTPGPSGQLPVNPKGLSAKEVVEWIDMGCNANASNAVMLNAMRKARAFVIAVFPDAA